MGFYSNFRARLMKEVLGELKKIKLLNKWHFVENKTEITQHVIKMWDISLMPTHLKRISRGVFSCIHTCKCRSRPCGVQ
jgi:hypothetical protein